MNLFAFGRPGPARLWRAVLFAATIVLVATALGGCFLLPRRTGSKPGSAAASGRLELRLVDEAGLPVVGAGASIPEAGAAVAVSGADGKVAFSGVAPGVYYVQVEKEGYLKGSFEVTVASTQTAQVEARMLTQAGNLHLGKVPNLCADCHKLHDPTPAAHQTRGESANAPCFTCHQAGLNRGFDAGLYENSPHGRVPAADSSTRLAWTGQPDSNRGYCSTCHEPHGIAGPPFLLRKGSQDGISGTLSLNNLCYECHAAPGSGNTAGWPGKTAYTTEAGNKHATITDPTLPRTYAAGDCAVCHVPHGQSFDGGLTNYAAMTRREGNLLCTAAGCHANKATANAGHGRCTLCHDPHNTGTAAQVKVKNPVTGAAMSVPKENYRNQTLVKNSYCESCHNANPPAGYEAAKDPYTETEFTNAQAKPDKDLHRVHVSKIRPDIPWISPFGDRSYDHPEYPYLGDINDARCTMCHSVHTNGKPYNLLPSVIITRTKSGSAYNGKPGCGVGAGCHTCNYCHAAPGGPAVDCSACSGDHFDPGIHGIVY